MLDFPVTLHEIETFQIGDQNYVVDLDRNELVLVNTVVRKVLEFCSSHSRGEILTRLAEQHTEGDIFEAFKCIEQFAEVDLLVSKTVSVSPSEDKRLRVLTFLNQMPASQGDDISANWSDYLLLEALTQKMEVTIGIPKTRWDESHSNEAAFLLIPIETDLTYAPPYHINAIEADVTIAFPSVDFDKLSTEASTVLPLFSSNNVPTLIRIHSGVQNEDVFLNSVLAVYAAKRPFDAIVIDAPWIRHRFFDILSSDVDFCFLPDPVDLERFKSYDDRLIGKRCINSIFDTQEIFKKPVVGIMTGQEQDINYHIGQYIAQVCPELFFLVWAPGLPDSYLNNLPSNLIFYTESEHLDTDARVTPMLLNALDVCFFHATLQNSSSLLSQCLACGVPTLVGTNYPIPEFENACAFLHSGRDITNREELIRLLDTLKRLLSEPPEMERLSREGRKLAECLSFEAISEQFIHLVSSLTQQQLESRKLPSYAPRNLFCYSYHRAHGTVRSQTLPFQSRPPETIERGIAKELLKSHAPPEVETLLTQICNGGKEEACQILESLSGSLL